MLSSLSTSALYFPPISFPYTLKNNSTRMHTSTHARIHAHILFSCIRFVDLYTVPGREIDTSLGIARLKLYVYKAVMAGPHIHTHTDAHTLTQFK